MFAAMAVASPGEVSKKGVVLAEDETELVKTLAIIATYSRVLHTLLLICPGAAGAAVVVSSRLVQSHRWALFCKASRNAKTPGRERRQHFTQGFPPRHVLLTTAYLSKNLRRFFF